MKKNIVKIDSILKELKTMHQFLGGGSLKADYTNENVELSQIMTLFRQEIFSIRNAQKQRDFKEGKLGKVHPELIKLNFAIREGIKKCQDMLLAAEKRAIKNKGFKNLSDQEKKKLKRQFDNCASMLLDVRQTEEGGIYRPPEAVSLQLLKQELLRQRRDRQDSERQSINVDQQEAFETFDKNDNMMDEKLDQIIDINGRVLAGAKATGQTLDEMNKKTKKLTKQMDGANARLVKTNDRLAQLVKVYRRPNKFCLDVTLVVLLLGLVAVIVNMATKKNHNNNLKHSGKTVGYNTYVPSTTLIYTQTFFQLFIKQTSKYFLQYSCLYTKRLNCTIQYLFIIFKFQLAYQTFLNHYPPSNRYTSFYY